MVSELPTTPERQVHIETFDGTLGRRIIDRYPLKTTYVMASGLQIVAMLGLAMGNGYVALAGAIFSAVLADWLAAAP